MSGPNGVEHGWRIVAGPELSPDQLFAATIPDGPGKPPVWPGGAYLRAEARNKAALEAHLEAQRPTKAQVAAQKRIEAQREADYVALVKARDGWRYGQPIVEAYRENPRIKALLASTGPDGLDIPDFLRRAPATEPLRMAA